MNLHAARKATLMTVACLTVPGSIVLSAVLGESLGMPLLFPVYFGGMVFGWGIFMVWRIWYEMFK